MLNISRQIYAGWDSGNTKYDLPEAEIVPYGESVNEKKKLDKISSKFTILREHENIPLPGFTLYKTDRKRWGSIDQTWLVIDPRGFLARISSENLEQILHVTGITEGLIQEKCVWARDDSQTKMILVPVSSEKYIAAVKNTELLEGKINIKDVNIGDKVIMQNGLTGIYRGVVSLYGPIYETSYKDRIGKPQTFLRRQIVEIDNLKFFYQTDVKILKVLEKTKENISREESVKYLNERIAAGALFTTTPEYSGRYYSIRGMIKHASTYAVNKPSVSLVEIDEFEATALFHDSNKESDDFRLAVETTPGNIYIVDFPYSFNGTNPATINSFDIARIKITDDKESVQVLDKKNSHYSARTKPGTHSLDRFTKFYKIVKHVKTETYV